jgi:hypothetical protein
MEPHRIEPTMTTAPRPIDRDTIAALRLVARVLDMPAAYWADGRFWFPLGDDAWSLSLSPDSAGRFRLGAHYGTTEVGSLWARANDPRRLADLAGGLRQEVLEMQAR